MIIAALCFIPIVLAVILLAVVFGFAGLYALAAIGIVVLAYAIVAALIGLVVLLVVWVLSLIPQSIMHFINGHEIEGPATFFENTVKRTLSALQEEEEGFQKAITCQADYLANISKIVKSKKFAVLLPPLLLFVTPAMSTVADIYIQAHAEAYLDGAKLAELNEKVGGSIQKQVELLFKSIPLQLQNVNEFVYEYLVEVPMQLPIVVEMVKEYSDPKVFMVAVASLADLGTKFAQFKKAVFAMRIGSGLLIGPLQFFEMLAKFDRAA